MATVRMLVSGQILADGESAGDRVTFTLPKDIPGFRFVVVDAVVIPDTPASKKAREAQQKGD
jgi:hypothetical protein